MDKIEQWIRPNIRKMEAYSSARDEYKQKKGVFLDANENPYGRFNRYPDPLQNQLKSSIAKIKGMPESHLFLGNGSDEAIDLLFRIFCRPGKDKALQWSPTYGMYQVAAAVNDVELLSLPLDEEFQPELSELEAYLDKEEVKLMFLCSPNNPTGNAMDEDKVAWILDTFNGIVVIDEAYIDFSKKASWMHKVKAHPHLVVLQTLSKAWGLAALRIGMAFAQPGLIQYFNKVKPPYNISQANQDLALEKLKDIGTFETQVEDILAQRSWLRTQLEQLEFVKQLYPSDANFLLIKVTEGPTLYERLVREGLIVRNRSKLVNNSLRITVGTEKENQLLISTLQKIQNEESTIY